MNTVAGCASTASPSGAKWTIDYSQQNAAQFTYTDLASAGTGLTVSSVLKPFAKQHVGNSLVITGGTNFNTGRYVIASISGVTATVVGPTNITTGAGASGTGGMGGALLSPGKADSLAGWTLAFCKNDGSVFSMTSNTNSISQGTIASRTNVCLVGYATTRTIQNTDSPPTIQTNGSTITQFQAATSLTCINFILDGNSQTASKLSSNGAFERCLIKNFNTASSGGTVTRSCKVTTNSAAVLGTVVTVVDTECYANTATPINATGSNSSLTRVLSYNNTGASTDGAAITAGATAIDCDFYANGRDGLRLTTAYAENCYSDSNVGSQFNAVGTPGIQAELRNCAVFVGTGGPATSGTPVSTGLITCSVSAFTNAAGTDFSKNNTAGGGASLRAAGYPQTFPAGTTERRGDIGASQHADPAGGFTGFMIQ
jgi:hypothetical protein